MNYLYINNWDEWQSYRKDRGTPPWIKVYRTLLSNPQWAALSDAEKGQLVSIWIVAADAGGKIPSNPVVIKKICQLDAEPNINKFKDLEFLVGESPQGGNHVVTTPPPDGVKVVAQETETETETYSGESETDKKEVDFENEFTAFWKEFPTHKRSKGSMSDAKAKYKIARKKATSEQIINGVKNYAIYIIYTGQSNQDAFRWLEKQRWGEEYTIGSTPSRTNAAPVKSKHERAKEALGIYSGQPDQPEPINITPANLF